MNGEQRRFLGKFRGRVEDRADPLKLGRIRATVPDVLGDHSSGWALPCFPLAGPGEGLFAVPPTGAWVWIEFEYGDPERPIWTGCFYPDDPASVASSVAQLIPLVGVEPDTVALKTKKWLVTIKDSKVVVASLLGPMPRTRLEVTATDIKLTNEQAPNLPSPPTATIEMTSRGTVRVNGSALEVT